MDKFDNAYCRLCAQLKPYKKLTDLQDPKCRDIVNKLHRVIAGIHLDTSNYPKTVCFVCIVALEQAYEFVTGAERAQTILSAEIFVQQIKREAGVSDTESSLFEVGVVNSDRDDRLIIFKNDHSNNEESVSKHSSSIKQRKSHKNNPETSVDAIPLAQLTLSWKDYSWICAFCETQFPSVEELKAHSIEYHKCCNAFRCSNCKTRKLRLDSFLTHVRRHRHYLKLSCHSCFQSFPTAHKMHLHRPTHVTSQYICLGCNTNFTDLIEFNRHTSMFYKDKRRREIPIQNLSDDLTCSICGKSFKNKSNLNTHLLTHTERRLDHICEICGKGFLAKRHLECHMITHSDVKPFKCRICKSCFKTDAQLRLHVSTHDGHKPFSCDQCGRCFRLQNQLNSHKIIHTDSLPHVCTYCHKSFRFKSILNQHIRQHTGAKPYSCDMCQRAFTNWPNYNKHMKRKHGKNMAKKRHTPDGQFPIDQNTGEIVYAEMEQLAEWKNSMMQHRRPGRPSVKSKEHTECHEDAKAIQSNNN